MSAHSLAVAQIASVRGDFAANLQRHLDVTAQAAAAGVELVIFPELSLTGYEPDLAAELAVAADGSALQPLRDAARSGNLTVAAGCPIAAGQQKPWLSAVVFGPDDAVRVYHKRFLHGPENDDFTAGCDPLLLAVGNERIGLAICADIHEPRHDSDLASLGATVYAAGVAIRDTSRRRAHEELSRMAQRHGMLTMMANYSQPTGGFDIHGGSGIWSPDGALLAAAAEGADQLLIAQRSDDQTWSGSVRDV